MDANGSAEGSHVVRHVHEHPLSRILPPSRFPEVRIPGLVAHSRVLRKNRCAVPPCACNTVEETVLGSYGRRTLANRLAADESVRIGEPQRPCTRKNFSHVSITSLTSSRQEKDEPSFSSIRMASSP